jgi:hypothetical protein
MSHVLHQIGHLVLAVTLGLLAPLQSASAESAKSDAPRQIEAKKAFPYMDRYLALPAETRDGLRLTYTMTTRDGAPLPRMFYVMGNQRTPLLVATDGTVLNPPDLAFLTSGMLEIQSQQRRGSINLNILPVIPLSRTIAVTSVNNALGDYASAVRQAAPAAIGFMLPRMKGVTFSGVQSGYAIFPDGRRTALSRTRNGLSFEPNAANMRGAVTLAFEQTPSVALFLN